MNNTKAIGKASGDSKSKTQGIVGDELENLKRRAEKLGLIIHHKSDQRKHEKGVEKK